MRFVQKQPRTACSLMLEAVLEKRNLGQGEAGKISGLHESEICRILSGSRRAIELHTAAKLYAAFGIPLCAGLAVPEDQTPRCFTAEEVERINHGRKDHPVEANTAGTMQLAPDQCPACGGLGCMVNVAGVSTCPTCHEAWVA